MTRASYGVDEGADVLIHAVQRTDGADTVLQPYRVEAEPEIATYTLTTASVVALATANSHVFQLMAGASLRVGVRRILVWLSGAAASTGSDFFAIYRLSTAGTGGTSVSPVPLDTADAAGGATGMTLPTAKGTETGLIRLRPGLVHATVETVGLNPILEFDFVRPRGKLLWIAAGTSNGIALKNLTADASASVRVEVEIVETDVV